jgi:hypothetical protein
MKTRWLIASLPVLAAACAGSHAEQVRDARMERVEENAEARDEQVEQRTAAREKALDQQYQAREDGMKAENAPGADQSAKLLDLSKERSQYQSEKREELDKLAVRIQAAQQKISVLSDRAPTKLKGELQTAQTEHNTLQKELSGLGQVRSNNWEGEKKRMDQRVSELDSRVDTLSSHIDDAD